MSEFGRELGEQGTTRWTGGDKQTPIDVESLLPGPGTGQWLGGVPSRGGSLT